MTAIFGHVEVNDCDFMRDSQAFAGALYSVTSNSASTSLAFNGSMTSPAPAHQDNSHIVSLVLQSKKALQHGKTLCSRASDLSNSSAQDALDILALNAKVKWLSDAVLEQLKVCASCEPWLSHIMSIDIVVCKCSEDP